MVCPYSLSIPGGVQEQTLSLARVLRARGIDVRVLAPTDGPPPDTGVTTLGASLPTAANGSIAPIAPDLPAQVRLIKALWNEQFDVIHLHEPLAPGIGITTVLMQAAPMVATFHAAGRSSAYRWVNRGCRSLRSRIDIGCAVSEDAEALASKWLGGTYERVFNGIDIDRFANASPSRSERPAVLFLGRHDERKGLGVLLRAAQMLDGAAADIELWIAGDGDLTGALAHRYRNDGRIEWLGRISDDEKLARLAGASVLCAPSLGGESFGIILLEAMAAGTPIVATNIAGYDRVTRFGADAILVPPNNAGALAEALSKTLAADTGDVGDGGDVGETGDGRAAGVAARVASGRERADEFSMTRLADLYIEKYERAMAQGGATSRRATRRGAISRGA